jgi:hypothetical protein
VCSSEDEKGDFMKSIRNYVSAAVLAVVTLSFAPNLASAQEPAHGKFTLTHEVRWGGARLPAGDYAFSYAPDNGSRTLTITKLSGARTGYMVLVPNTDDAKPSDTSRLVLVSTRDGSYVSAMLLPEFGMTLHFTVPSHTMERQIAKAGTTALVNGQ